MDWCPTAWPVDWSCNETATTELDESIVMLAETIAGKTLHALVGFAVGGCPETVRPCRSDLSPQLWAYYGVTGWGQWMIPYMTGGEWTNVLACSQSDCLHGPHALPLPGPVGRVDEVKIDGEVLVEDVDYKVYGSVIVLVSRSWPTSQDLALSDDAEGTASVTYLRAEPVGPDGEYVAGLLANEIAKACGGGECALPMNVRQVVRPGITQDLSALFEDGKTGILAVDAYVLAHNPYGKKNQVPGIYSATRRNPPRQG